MVIYCSVLAILLETRVLLAALVWPEVLSDVTISREAAMWALVGAAVVDTLAMFGGFRVAAPRYLKSYIEKFSTEVPADD
jgi:hypothetical protein